MSTEGDHSMGAAAELLASYVPPLVVAHIARDPACAQAPRAEAFEGVVLFADIAGFTTLTEQVDAAGPKGVEELSRTLNAYFAELIDLIAAHGGHVMKFAGDALIAIWTDAEAPLPALAHGAALCAVAIQQRMGGHRAAAGVPLSIRVSLGAGGVLHLVLGGVAECWDSMLDGAALAEARGAIAFAEPGEILLGPGAVAALGDAAEIAARPGGSALLRSVTPAALKPAALSTLNSQLSTSPGQPPAVDPEAMRALRLHVNAAVRDRLEAGQAGWLAEFRRLSVLFINVPEVATAGAAGLDRAQQVMRVLQTLLHRYEATAESLGDDHAGLTLVAVLGLPAWSHEDDPARAVRIAIAARRELRDLGLQSAIGVTTGRLFCGSIGSARRRTYSLVGDAMNRCARLMRLAENDIFCDEPTRAAAAARHFRFEFLRSAALRGKTLAVQVFRPLGEYAALPARRRGIVGRGRERDAIRARLSVLRGDGAGGVFVVEGEAGIGKSTLLGELRTSAQAEGLRVFEGAGDSIERTTSYHAWQRVFSDVLGFPAETDAAERCDLLLERLAASPDLVRMAPLLNPALGLHLPENEITAEMSAQSRAEATSAMLAALLGEASAAGPLVVVLDDCQWLDSASWTLASDLHRDVPRLLLVLLTRPPDATAPAAWTALRAAAGGDHLALGPLRGDDALALVCDRLGIETLPAPAAALIREKAEGHPFFSQELGYALRDSGLLVIDGRRCELAADAGELRRFRFPGTVQGLISERIDRLSSRDRLALKVASVAGQSFQIETLRAIHPVEHDREELPASLDRLVEQDFAGTVEHDGITSFVFRHAIVREVAYEQLPYSNRRELHRRLAEWLEPQDDASHPALAHHWRQAEVPGRAIHHLGRAADEALRRFANREVIEFLDQALYLSRQHALSADALTRGRWHRQLGEAHYHLGLMERSREILGEATRILGQPMPDARALRMVALPHAAAIQLWRRLGAPIFRPPTPPAEPALEAMRAFNLLGEIAFFTNDLPASVFTIIHGLNLAESLRPAPPLADLYASMMIVTAAMPPTALGRHYFDLAERALATTEPPVSRAYVHELMAIYHSGLGHWEKVAGRLVAAREIFQRFGNGRRLEECHTLAAYTHIYRGRFAPAAEAVAEMERSATRRDDAQICGWVRLIRAQILLPTEGPAAALKALGDDESIARDALTRVGFHALTAAGRLRLGDVEAARSHAETALALIASTPPTAYTMLYYTAYPAEVLLRLLARAPGDRALRTLARRACRAMSGYARAFPIGRARAELLRGIELSLHRRPCAAATHWRRAAKEGARLEMAFDVTLAQSQLGGAPAAGEIEFAAELAHWPVGP